MFEDEPTAADEQPSTILNGETITTKLPVAPELRFKAVLFEIFARGIIDYLGIGVWLARGSRLNRCSKYE
jgi:hypothetical protein